MEDKNDELELTPVEESLENSVPRSALYPPIYTPHVDTTPRPPDDSEEREKEQTYIVESFRAIPEGTFAEIRENEIDRLNKYYDALTEIYGIDIRSIARTRTQMNATVMVSSLALIENPFPENPTKQEGQTFFESRLSVKDATFRANGGMKPTDNFHTIFSVGAVTLHDDQGSFEVDFPVYSLPREFFKSAVAWHKDKYGNDNLAESPFIQNANSLMSRRIHDWIHAAVLYDTQALTEIFQDWANDIYFVPHILDDAGMINYELLANHVQYKVWQHIFEKDPDAKKEVIQEAKQYLKDLEELKDFMNQKDPDNDLNAELIEHMAYVGMRGVFDIIDYDDPELIEALNDFAGFKRSIELLPEKSRLFLDAIYKTNELPFGMREEKIMGIDAILLDYMQKLHIEATQYRNLQIIEGFANDVPKDGRTPLNAAYQELPQPILDQIVGVSGEGNPKFLISMDKMDFRIFRQLNEELAKIKDTYGEKIYEAIVKKVEVDKTGHFYFKIDREDVDLSNAEKIVQRKGALLIQATEPIDLTVIRRSNLTNKQEGGKETVEPGEIIVINTPNEALAKELLRQATDGETVDFQLLFKLAKQKATKGFVELDDIYPNSADKILDVYQIDDQKQKDGKVVIKPGFYYSKPNTRRGVRMDVVSMDSTKQNTDRRRILEGAVVENHIQKEGETDIFPVDSRSFNRIYAPTKYNDLPHIKLNDRFLEKAGLAPDDKEEFEQAFEKTLKTLAKVNDIRVNGMRGKPILKPRITSSI
jgi:hypothetical protein